MVIRVPTTTPPTTLVRDSRLCALAPTNTLHSHVASDIKQLSVRMTATLSAELGGEVPDELVAEIVQTVLDESRQAAQNRAVEFTMLEARKRLERFIRARSPR